MNPTEHGPVQPAVRDKMNVLARRLDEMFNGPLKKEGMKRDWGFALLVFPFGDAKDRRVSYIGNAQRDQMLTALKELVQRWEADATTDKSGEPK